MYEFDMTKNRAAYKAHLDDIGVQTLPDQPGKRGFTAEEVKLHFKAPIDFLFALIGKNLNEMTDVLAKYDLSIEEAQKEIKEIQNAMAKGILFSPALQDTAPDPSQVRVWLDTSGSKDTQEEIPKEEEASDTDDQTIKAEEKAVIDFDPDDGSISFPNVNDQPEETKFANVNASTIEVEFANVNENGSEQTNFANVNEESGETFSNVNEAEETMFKNVNESDADELKLGK